MLLFKMLLVLAVSGWMLVSTHRRISLPEFGRAWRVCLILFSLIGIGVGICFLNVRYLVSPTARAYGVPFVIAGGDFINGRWVDGGVGRFLYLAALTDIASGVALCVLPLAVISFLRHLFGHRSEKRLSHAD